MEEFTNLELKRVEQNNLWRGISIDWTSRTTHFIFVITQIVRAPAPLANPTLGELITTLEKSRSTGIIINIYRETGLTTCIQTRLAQLRDIPYFPITKTYKSFTVTPPIKDDVENLRISV